MEATDVGCGEVVRCAEGAVSSRSRGMGRGGWGAHIEAEDDGVDGGVVAVKDILPARVRRVRDLGERHAHVRSQRHRRLSGRVRRNRHLRRHPGVAVLDETLGLCVVHVDLAAARQERRACRHLLGDARSLLARNLLLLRRHSFGVRARGRCVKKKSHRHEQQKSARDESDTAVVNDAVMRGRARGPLMALAHHARRRRIHHHRPPKKQLAGRANDVRCGSGGQGDADTPGCADGMRRAVAHRSR